MEHDRRSQTLGNGHARTGSAPAGLTRHPQRERAESAPLVLIASPVRGLRQAWNQGLKGFAAAEVTDHAQLKRWLAERPPAVLLLDLELPQLGGMDGVGALRALQAATKIIVLASRPDEKVGLTALKMGAQGYCDRAITPALLGKALDAVLNGEVWVGRKLTSHLLDELSALADAREEKEPVADMDSRLNRLTRRERDIVGELGVGATNKEIAQKLAVTERTVKAHLTAAFRKLETPGRLQAALLMVEHTRSAHP